MKKILLVSFILSLVASISAFSQEMGFSRIKDGTLYYKIYGEGYPILIINGGPGMNSDGFSSLAELLSDKNKTILFDQRGTGKSKLTLIDSSTVTLDLMIQDIETLRHDLKINKWIILGHSFGGWLAQYYASKYPESIKAMILSGSAGIDLEILKYFAANKDIRLGKSEKDSLNYWTEMIKRGDTTYNAKYQQAKALAPIYLYNKEFIPLIAKRLTQSKSNITELVYKDIFKIKYNCKNSLANFQKPILIIQGRQDLVGTETAYNAHSIFKNSKLVFINECGHYGWLDQREIYKFEIGKFIESVN